jgi:hypothetical protein
MMRAVPNGKPLLTLGLIYLEWIVHDEINMSKAGSRNHKGQARGF